MHEALPSPAGERRAAASAAIDGHFAHIPAVGRLPAGDLSRYCEIGYSLGWRVDVDFSDGKCRTLHLLADNGFPYTPLRVAVADGPDVLAWPHLEPAGFLCVFPPDTAISGETPAAAAAQVLGEACQLIEDSIYGRNIEDFRREFLSYWALAANVRAWRYISLLEPRGPSRRICVWRGQYARVVGESEADLCRWLPRWGAKLGNRRDRAIRGGALIWLPEPLLPAEYPRTAADIRALARERSPAAMDTLESLATTETSGLDVLLGAETSNGACFAAVTVHPPGAAGAQGRRADMLMKGFRPGRVPHGVLVNRYLSGAGKVTKSTVERADHQWIHGRDQDRRQNRLRRLRVAVLGCGSLGGALARILAQAGIGNLLLTDPDILDWPNVSRHELGAQSVRRAKAPALAREIERAHPHLGEVTVRRDRVGPDAKALLKELMSYDLVVSTMGNWPAESFLNDVQQHTDGFPPIVYGWVEPNAAAAHALLVAHGEACLRCGTNDKGRPHRMVTDWPGGVCSRKAPACGALFTPYGPTELAWAHALLGETVIDALTGEAAVTEHRVWIAPRSRVEGAGGKWSPAWIEAAGDPGAGGITVQRRWLANPSCPVCHCSARVA